jgi:hypothetical protein
MQRKRKWLEQPAAAAAANDDATQALDVASSAVDDRPAVRSLADEVADMNSASPPKPQPTSTTAAARRGGFPVAPTTGDEGYDDEDTPPGSLVKGMSRASAAPSNGHINSNSNSNSNNNDDEATQPLRRVAQRLSTPLSSPSSLGMNAPPSRSPQRPSLSSSSSSPSTSPSARSTSTTQQQQSSLSSSSSSPRARQPSVVSPTANNDSNGPLGVCRLRRQCLHPSYPIPEVMTLDPHRSPIRVGRLPQTND